MSTGTQTLSDQCQTNGPDIIGSECYTGTNKILIDQCKISRHNLSLYNLQTNMGIAVFIKLINEVLRKMYHKHWKKPPFDVKCLHIFPRS